jgi:glycerol-3-phosphate acyltransferase PlsX
VLLKFAEAVGEVFLQLVEEEFAQELKGKVDTKLLRPSLNRIRKRLDHVEHGGCLLLGVDGICVISHGSSQATSIFNAIRLAKEAVTHQVIDRIQSRFEKTTAEAVNEVE